MGKNFGQQSSDFEMSQKFIPERQEMDINFAGSIPTSLFLKSKFRE